MSWFRRGRDRSDEPGRWVIVGLGNPGERYASTRHNLGAMTVDVLLERSGGNLKSHKSGCLIAEVSLAGEPAVLARPTTYMNDSGRPVGQLVRFFHSSPERVIVLHDELDIPFGDVRVKSGGGTAGHNGLRSIVNHLGTNEFPRIRMGIGRPRGDQDAVKKVLDSFSSSERKELPAVLETAADAVETIVSTNIERAMNTYNTKER